MEKQKISLVLSMGGARGIAHIGVIETLLEYGYEIASITGSSMGAMVGAMYATGRMTECKEWLCSWDNIRRSWAKKKAARVDRREQPEEDKPISHREYVFGHILTAGWRDVK